MADTTTAPDILHRALEVFQERGQQRDAPNGERSIPAVVKAFGILTGIEMTDQQGWLFMALVKIKRSQSGKPDADHYVDGANYVALAGEAALARQRWPVASVYSHPPMDKLAGARTAAHAGMQLRPETAAAHHCTTCDGLGNIGISLHEPIPCPACRGLDTA